MQVRKKGCLKSSMIQNEIDWNAIKILALNKNNCTICRKSDHNRQKCLVNNEIILLID